MELIDSHCHLDQDDYNDDLSQVIDRAREAGVVHIVTIGIDPASSARAISLAETYDFISATVGYHPHDVAALTSADLDRLRDLAASPQVVGFGEIGLDFFRNLSPRDLQLKRFDDLIQLGLDLELPLVIHDRDAHQEVLEFLTSARAGRNGGIIHCYSGGYDLARKFIDLGFHISIPGTITFPKADVLRDVVARLPLDTLLIETDAPWLAPVPKRGRRNEPALVRHTANEVAKVKGVSVEEVGRVTSANTRQLFHLPPTGRVSP